MVAFLSEWLPHPAVSPPTHVGGDLLASGAVHQTSPLPGYTPAPHVPSLADFAAFGHWFDALEVGTSGGGVQVTQKPPAGTTGQPTYTAGVGPGGISVSTSTTTPTPSGDRDHTTSVTTTGSGAGISTSTTQHAPDGTPTTTTNGGVSVGGDGVTVTGGATQSGWGGSGSVTVGPGSVGVSVTAQAPNAGVTFSVTHADNQQTLATADDHSPVASVLDGRGYFATSRVDDQKLGGNLSAGAISLGGDTSSRSQMQVFQALPADWASRSPEDQAAWRAQMAQQQQQVLGGLGGLADVNLDTLPAGAGVHFATMNGWNATAGVNYGAISASLGGGQSTAHDVTIARRDDGKLEVSMVNENGSSSQLGAAIAGFGLTLGDQGSNAHEVKFQVDPSNPQAMAAMRTFMQTGLLPGADAMTDPASRVAAATFKATKVSVDALTTAIAQLPPGDPRLGDLAQQLDSAQHALDSSRTMLNDAWQAQYGQHVGTGPIAGVAVDQVTDTRQNTTSGGITTPLGTIGLPSDTRTWVQQQYISANDGSSQERFGFDENSYFGHQSATTDTDPNGIVLRMASDNKLGVTDNAAIIRNIQSSDLPSYVLDEYMQHGNEFRMPWDQSRVSDGLSGRTTVAMTAQQLDAMTTSLNDMNNPKSAAMWSDFAARTSAFMAGNDFTLKTGDQQTDGMFAQGQLMSRRSWLMDVQSRDPSDPVRVALSGYGGDLDQQVQAAAAQFATVKTPADFQKLSLAQQQLYIATLQQTTGRDHDLTGQRSSYEALAASALLHDGATPGNDAALRARSMRDVFEDANNNALDDYSDGVFAFVKFTDRFKDDPATYAQIQNGIQFHWNQADVENIAKNATPDGIQQAFQQSYASRDLFGNANGTQQMFQLVEAANHQGGSQQVQQMVKAAGADPAQMLHQLASDPTRQHMLYDMLQAAGVDVSGAELAFCP